MNIRVENFVSDLLRQGELLRNRDLHNLMMKVFKCAVFYFFLSLLLDITVLYDLYDRIIWPRPTVCLYLFLLSLLPTAVSAIILAKKANKKFKKNIKELYLPEVLKKIPSLTVDEKGFDKLLLEKSNLFSAFNSVEYDDIFAGVYKDKEFKMAEMKVLDFGKKTTIKTLFSGVGIGVSVPKNFSCQTIVVSKYDFLTRNIPFNFIISFVSTCFCFFIAPPEVKVKLSATLFVFFIILLIEWDLRRQGLLPFVKLEKVSLEDILFSKRYTVYSEQQVEARRLITPVFMEKLKNIETAFGTRKLKCSFFEDYIFISVSSKNDLFELGSLFQRLDTPNNGRRFLNELTAVYGLIDYVSDIAKV
ncbi:MAG: DUF3137 domain-containing protein [Alphaproteobacteria bacterium]|nr:DUF3137 domain-containing protein [Alphaproteobacteria bacterium]MBR3502168.1 DUF3137 domain-containing protein [Alphaproteobacteria bacterium]